MGPWQWAWLAYQLTRLIWDVLKERKRRAPELGNSLYRGFYRTMREVRDTGRFELLDRYVDEHGLTLDVAKKRMEQRRPKPYV